MNPLNLTFATAMGNGGSAVVTELVVAGAEPVAKDRSARLRCFVQNEMTSCAARMGADIACWNSTSRNYLCETGNAVVLHLFNSPLRAFPRGKCSKRLLCFEAAL